MSVSSIIGTWEVDGNFVACNPRVGADVIKAIFLEFVDKMGFEAAYWRACKIRNDRSREHGAHGRLPENRIEFLNYHVRNRSRSKNFIDRFSWEDSPPTGCNFSWVELNSLWLDLYYANDLDCIVSADEVYQTNWDYDDRFVWESGELPYIPDPIWADEPPPPCSTDLGSVSGNWVVSARPRSNTLNTLIYSDSVRYSTSYEPVPDRPSTATDPDFDYTSLFDDLPL